MTIDCQKNQLMQVLGKSLYEMYGPLVTSRDLWKILGFPTPTAYRQARARGRLPIKEFTLEGRRGHFALTQDVIHWLAEQRSAETINITQNNHLNEKEDADE